MAKIQSPTEAAKQALSDVIKASELFIAALDAAQADFPPAEPGITLAGQNDIQGMKHHVQMKLQDVIQSRRAYEPLPLPTTAGLVPEGAPPPLLVP
jgi:hypothetical protein